MPLPSKPKILVRLKNPEWRQQAYDLMGVGKPAVRRTDGKLYLVAGFDPGADSDRVTLDPNVSPDHEAVDVRW